MTTPVAPEATPEAVAPEVAPVVAPEVTPETTPEAAPVAEPEVVTKPMTRAESLVKMREGLAKRREELSAPAEETPEGEVTPEVTPEATETPEVVPSVEGEAVPEATPEATPAVVEAPASPAFTINVDPNHPVAGLGQKTIEVKTPQEERVIKALLNGSYTRRAEVEEALANEKHAKQELLKVQSKLQAEDEWRSSPEYQARVAQYQKMRGLEEAGDLDPGTAAAFWKSGIPEVEAKADAVYQQGVAKIEQDEVDRAANLWVNDAFMRASKLPANITALPTFRQYFDEAVELFGTAVAAGRYAHIKAGDAEALHNEFTRFLSGDLIRRPDVNAAYQQSKVDKEAQSRAAADAVAAQAREKAAIEQAAVEKFKKDRADQRRESPTHPLANLPATHDSTPPSKAGDEEEHSAQSPSEFRKRSQKRARARGRAFQG